MTSGIEMCSGVWCDRKKSVNVEGKVLRCCADMDDNVRTSMETRSE